VKVVFGSQEPEVSMNTVGSSRQRYPFLRSPWLLIGMGGLALALAYPLLWQPPEPMPAANVASVPAEGGWWVADNLEPAGGETARFETAVAADVGVARETRAPQVAERANLAPARNAPAGNGFVERSKRASPTVLAEVESTPVAQDLLDELSDLMDAEERLTAADIDEMIRILDDLVDLGGAAVAAIREFLWSMEDFDLSESAAGAMDYSTLRLNLIDVLNRIGDPEALHVMAETLYLTSDPAEIGSLASALEGHVPGVYRRSIVSAARGSLIEIQNRQQREVGDVAPLFAVLQDYGDASVVFDLQQVYPRFKNYTAAALANLPHGAGIPALMALVDDAEAVAQQPDSFTVLMLAQSSRHYPEAGELLVDLAGAGQLSRSNLVHIGLTLAGREYALKMDSVNKGPQDTAAGGQSAATNPVSIESDRNAADQWSAVDIEQRLTLIDQLLDTDPDPYAAGVLERSRNVLSTRLDSQGS